MRKVLFILGLPAALLAAAPADAAGQIDQLKAGKLQCYAPNSVRRTCAALSGYTFGGVIMNQAEVLISADPVGTMRTNSPVTLKGEAICGVPSKKDIDSAVIISGGQALTVAQAAGVKAQIWATVASRAGQEVCTTYLPSGDHYNTQYTLGGKPDTATPSTTVILVDAKDGYRVAP